MKISTQLVYQTNSFNRRKTDNKFQNIFESEIEKQKETKEYSPSKKTNNSVDDIVLKHIDEKIKKDLHNKSKFYEDPIKELRNLWGYGNFDKFS